LTVIINKQLFETLIDEYNSGKNVAELASIYGVTPKAIWSRFKRHGVITRRIMRRLTDSEVDMAVQMYKDGTSYKAIAIHHKTTIPNISNRLRRRGIIYEGPSRRMMLCHMCRDQLTELNVDPAFMAASNYTCRKCGKAKRFSKTRRLKIKVLMHYGAKCVCCGESQIEFLTLDHINNDGAKHKRTIKKRGSQFYRWIVQNLYPNFLRVLCWNCNCALGSFGYCPHAERMLQA
jgi:hypothetical protein